jgi:hypothetical protein
MTPDARVTESSSATRKSAQAPPPLKVLIVSSSLESGRRFPPPVDFANALVEQGMSVLFGAAVGPLRKGLSRTVGYLLIDDAESAPVKTAHELMRLIHHHKPDVVHAHGARCAMVTALAAKACRSKCARVMTFYSPGLRRFPRWIKSPVLRHVADHYFAANDALALELEGLGIAENRIQVEAIDEGHASKFALDSIVVYHELVDPSGG